MNNKLLNSLLLSIILLFVSCNKNKTTEPVNKDLIISIDSLTHSSVKKIIGNQFNSKSIIKANQSFHNFKASQADFNELSKAKVIFYNNFTLSGELEIIIKKLKLSGKNVFAIDSYFSKNTFIENNKNSYDPHFWMDPYLWKKSVSFIENQLVTIYPNNEEYFRENASNYQIELDDLIKFINLKITEIPAKNRIIILDHDSFSYFGKRFNFQTKSILDNNLNKTESLTKISDFIINKKAPAIFTDKSLPITKIKKLSAMLKGKGYNIKFGGALNTDSIGTHDEELSDYIAIYKHNLLTIVSALK